MSVHVADAATHPILAAAQVIDEALKTVADTNPTFMPTPDKGAALRELARIESRVAELRLRILDADDLAATTAARDSAAWYSHHTHTRPEDARADLTLGVALDRRYPALASALRDGSANLAQAQVIARILDDLPSEVSADVLVDAETTLVGYCQRFGPRQIHKLGRRILAVVSPDLADAAEARRLAELEQAAHRRTRLSLRRTGDGTTRISGLLPDPVATRLATYLEAFTNPRKQEEHRPEANPLIDPVSRLPYGRRLGDAFCQLLETLDPGRLPLHAGDATTLIVTLDLEALRAELGTARLLGHTDLPGDSSSDDQITAADARRLACTARIIPAVLGGDSEVLDLGRARRLFTSAQRKALLLRDPTCRAEGCEIPGTWAEAHHWTAWQDGGRTDLANGVLLCRHHHMRAHGDAYDTARLPSGDIRFHRRR